VNLGQSLQKRPLGSGQLASGFQVVGQALGFVERPSLEGEHELPLVNNPVLECEQSKEEMAVVVDSPCESPGLGVVPSTSDRDHGARSPLERCRGSILTST